MDGGKLHSKRKWVKVHGIKKAAKELTFPEISAFSTERIAAQGKIDLEISDETLSLTELFSKFQGLFKRPNPIDPFPNG